MFKYKNSPLSVASQSALGPKLTPNCFSASIGSAVTHALLALALNLSSDEFNIPSIFCALPLDITSANSNWILPPDTDLADANKVCPGFNVSSDPEFNLFYFLLIHEE
jgi:hypothetical protein